MLNIQLNETGILRNMTMEKIDFINANATASWLHKLLTAKMTCYWLLQAGFFVEQVENTNGTLFNNAIHIVRALPSEI
jgi:hypothetical protein